jgi:hypothetical protein
VLVDTVVDDFVDKVVESIDTRTPDIHRRPLSDGIEALKDFDLIGAVAV